MKKKVPVKNTALSRRLHYPEEEKRIAWLPLLLDAYAVVDTGVAIAVRDEEKKRKRRVACGKGCGNCCSHQKDLPVYPHELVGIYWYATEKTDEAMKHRLKTGLANRDYESPCPFLIDGACAIHPVRPVGCRQFNVFTTPCAPGEDPYHTRREDVLVPLTEYTDRAFAAVAAFYPELRGMESERAVKKIRTQIMNLRSYDWNRLASLLG